MQKHTDWAAKLIYCSHVLGAGSIMFGDYLRHLCVLFPKPSLVLVPAFYSSYILPSAHT